MLPEFIELEVVTPERHVLHENVQSLEMPGKEGYLGILPGHAPLLTELGIGVLTYQKGRGIHALTVMQGYAEVLPDRVIILAELSERAEEIDAARAQRAVERAQEELTRVGVQHGDWERLTQALERAKVRLQAASKPPSQTGR